jgi:DNA-binding SARP family transcriptional activator
LGQVLDFRLLGPLEVTDDSGPLDLGGREQRALLVMLLLQPGRTVSFDRLIDALEGGRASASRVRDLLTELEEVLGPDVLEWGAHGCRLRIRSGQIDVDRFRVLLEAAKRGTPSERAQSLRHALALWRGPVLMDFEDQPFAQAYIARLEELRTAAKERLAGKA